MQNCKVADKNVSMLTYQVRRDVAASFDERLRNGFCCLKTERKFYSCFTLCLHLVCANYLQKCKGQGQAENSGTV